MSKESVHETLVSWAFLTLANNEQPRGLIDS
jgi:hypothetical protein